MKRIVIIIGIVVALGVAYYALSPLWRNVTLDEVSPLAAVVAVPDQVDPSSSDGVLASAQFVAQAHEVEGRAQLIKIGADHTVRFEDFKTINGPDVNIYLATDTSAQDFIDLGDIKATEGNMNYAVPAETDFTKYDTVLVWCKDFNVLFSYAELK